MPHVHTFTCSLLLELVGCVENVSLLLTCMQCVIILSVCVYFVISSQVIRDTQIVLKTKLISEIGWPLYSSTQMMQLMVERRAFQVHLKWHCYMYRQMCEYRLPDAGNNDRSYMKCSLQKLLRYDFFVVDIADTNYDIVCFRIRYLGETKKRSSNRMEQYGHFRLMRPNVNSPGKQSHHWTQIHTSKMVRLSARQKYLQNLSIMISLTGMPMLAGHDDRFGTLTRSYVLSHLDCQTAAAHKLSENSIEFVKSM